MSEQLDNAIAWRDHVLESAAKLQDMQLEFARAVTERQLAEQQIVKQQLENAKSRVELVKMQWKFDQQVRLSNGFQRRMRSTTKELDKLAHDLICVTWVESLRDYQLPHMWSAWTRVSRLVSAGWSLGLVEGSSMTILEFISNCKARTPEIGSEEHLALCRLFSVSRLVVEEKTKTLEQRLEKLLQGQLDVWKDV